jgi:hypothetical protein
MFPQNFTCGVRTELSTRPRHHPGPALADQAATAVTVKQAMQELLPNAESGFEVFDLQTNAVLTSQDASQQFASMSRCRDGGETDVGLTGHLGSQDIRLPTNWAFITIYKTN